MFSLVNSLGEHIPDFLGRHILSYKHSVPFWGASWIFLSRNAFLISFLLRILACCVQSSLSDYCCLHESLVHLLLGCHLVFLSHDWQSDWNLWAENQFSRAFSPWTLLRKLGFLVSEAATDQKMQKLGSHEDRQCKVSCTISLLRGFLYWFPAFELCDVSQTLEGDEKIHGWMEEKGREKGSTEWKLWSMQICIPLFSHCHTN